MEYKSSVFRFLAEEYRNGNAVATLDERKEMQ